MDRILDNIIDSIQEYKDHAIDRLELLSVLESSCEKIADKYDICLNCKCYKEIREWEEYHPYGDTYVVEHWSEYYCPYCGKDDSI